MKRIARIVGVAFFSLCTIVCASVALSIVMIFAGFRSDAEFPVDCGLVFGAAISGRDSAGPAIIRRVDGAAQLWKDGSINKLILTGGKGDSWRSSEAAVMRERAIRDGVDPRAMYLEDSARSTKENLAFSLTLVRENCISVVAISDQYHLARIRLLANKAGWGRLDTYGVPSRPEQGESRSILREWIAYVYYAFGIDNVMELDVYDDHPVDESTGTKVP